MARPGRKTIALGLGAAILFLIGANIQAGWLYVLGASLVGVLGAGLVVPAVVLRGVQARRWLPAVATAGDELNVRLELGGESARSGGTIEIEDEVLSGTRLVVERMGTGGARAEYKVRAERRGVFTGANLLLQSGFPFGIGVSSRRIWVDSPIIVHPRWVPLQTFPMLEAGSVPAEPIHERRRRGAGLDFFGIREYRPGDSLRHVHWRSTARGGRLLVREYEEQPASRMGILIDASEDFGTFEIAVEAAASLAVYGLTVGHPVQLFCDSTAGLLHLFEPNKNQALDWLAALSPRRGSSLRSLAQEASFHLRPRSTNVAVFASTRGSLETAAAVVGFLQSLSTRAVAVVISARTFAEGGPRVLTEEEEKQLLDALVGARAIVYLIEKQKGLGECLREPYAG